MTVPMQSERRKNIRIDVAGDSASSTGKSGFAAIVPVAHWPWRTGPTSPTPHAACGGVGHPRGHRTPACPAPAGQQRPEKRAQPSTFMPGVRTANRFAKLLQRAPGRAAQSLPCGTRRVPISAPRPTVDISATTYAYFGFYVPAEPERTRRTQAWCRHRPRRPNDDLTNVPARLAFKDRQHSAKGRKRGKALEWAAVPPHGMFRLKGAGDRPDHGRPALPRGGRQAGSPAVRTG